MQISSDGMSESKSTKVSLDIFSSRMKNCRTIFPHKIVRPLHTSVINQQDQFRDFVQNILENKGEIEQFVGDNLKRSTAKNFLCHSAAYACDYCLARAVGSKGKDISLATKTKLKKICQKLKNVNHANLSAIEKELAKAEKDLKCSKRRRLVWPFSTFDGPPRTSQNIQETVEQIEERGKLPLDEAKGVIGKSALTMIPNFSLVRDAPTEYLHSTCLGVGKRLLELTFKIGETRSRVTKRKLSNPDLFNNLMKQVKVNRECSRRSRELDLGVMKGQELRNVIIFFFPLTIECIEENNKERRLWLQFAYMIRSCIIPTKEFKNIPVSEIYETCKNFYKLYESLFRDSNCTYNTHVVCSHLLEMRVHGPLTMTSAFGFESFYGEIRHSFTPGTQSTLKQIFQKILLQRTLGHHCCESKIYYSAKDTPLESNSLIYCYKDLTHKFYKIVAVRKNYVVCVKQGRQEHSFPDLPNLNWAKVGVYKKGLITDEKVIIQKKNIDGKAMLVQDLLITSPNNILREK